MSEQMTERVEAELDREPVDQAPLVVEDDLVEEVSIDGMCGVY